MLRKFLLLLAALSFFAASAFARSHHSVSGSVTSCDEDNVYTDDEGYPEQASAQEEHMIPAGSFTRLDVESFRNNGVTFTGWSNPGAKLVVCKFAAGATKAEAEALLPQLKVEISGGKISGSGPEDEHAFMQFILFVPANVTAGASATNGPIEVKDVTGSFNLETENGPIDLSRVNGTVTAHAENGPIEIDESSGDINLRTVNGPISVHLASGHWQGKGLEAHVENGPLEISVPKSYESGVEITMSGNAPLECSHCQLTQDYGRRYVRLGAKDGPALVRMSTINGPVQIGGAMNMADDDME